MKIIAKLNSFTHHKDDVMNLSLLVDNFQFQKLCEELKSDIPYSIEIKEAKSKRSIEQNKKMWAMIHDIAERYGTKDDMEIYAMALEKNNCQYEYIMGIPAMLDNLKKAFRVVTLVRYEDFKGKKMAIFKCFIGSSKFNKSEMAEMIDTLLDIGADLGIDSIYWREVFK